MTNKISKHPPSHEQALPAGTQLEEFVIERVLGVGGFGITYLAKDSSLGRQVVIKENLPAQFCWRDTHALTVRPRHTEGEDADNDQYSLDSFEREASTLASLDHPGIVKVLRSFQAHGTAYFVMPFVEGSALDEVIRQRASQGTPFTEAEIQDLLAKVLNALGYPYLPNMIASAFRIWIQKLSHGLTYREMDASKFPFTLSTPSCSIPRSD
jgi:serine/threonine protein kinase